MSCETWTRSMSEENRMTELTKYECRTCGNRFEVPVLTDKERREAERDRQPVYGIKCPRCGSPNLKRI
jgi:DNA-directed RNA polymerase subunit RPC12/RpoP